MINLSFSTGKADRMASSRSLRAERIDALAAIAGGATHELNNILATVLMSLGVFAKGCTEPGTSELLRSVEETARRGLQLTRQMQWLARGVESEAVVFQPRFLLSDLQTLLIASFPRSLMVVTEYPNDLELLRADPLVVYQLLLALALEARTAIGDSGKITLAAGNHVVGEPPQTLVGFEIRGDPEAAKSAAPPTAALAPVSEAAHWLAAAGATWEEVPMGPAGWARRFSLPAVVSTER
jgi:signal transduction histidine kinase